MDSSGVLDVSSAVEASGSEVLASECEVKGSLSLVEGGERVSPKIRRSERKMPIRSISGHLFQSRPKSPLLRMAEMRRDALRGKALKQTEFKRVKDTVRKYNKGSKNPGGRGGKVLSSVPECGVSDVEVENEEGLAMVVVEGRKEINLGEEASVLRPTDEVFEEMSQDVLVDESRVVPLGVPSKDS